MRNPAPLVLIIDDDDDSRYVYARLLSHGGYEVAEANDAVSGLALARDVGPALIIMDYLLPGLSGWDATRVLKADPRTDSIPVVNVTAYSYNGIADDARAAGCDAFIEKPCDPFDVIRAVAGLIGRPETPARAPRPPQRLDTGDAAVA